LRGFKMNECLSIVVLLSITHEQRSGGGGGVGGAHIAVAHIHTHTHTHNEIRDAAGMKAKGGTHHDRHAKGTLEIWLGVPQVQKTDDGGEVKPPLRKDVNTNNRLERANGEYEHGDN
jgi:hypothetical protein